MDIQEKNELNWGNLKGKTHICFNVFDRCHKIMANGAKYSLTYSVVRWSYSKNVAVTYDFCFTVVILVRNNLEYGLILWQKTFS